MKHSIRTCQSMYCVRTYLCSVKLGSIDAALRDELIVPHTMFTPKESVFVLLPLPLPLSALFIQTCIEPGSFMYRYYFHILSYSDNKIIMSKVCQMLSWQTKNQPHFINIRDTVTNMVLLHSVHHALSHEPILTLLAPFPT